MKKQFLHQIIFLLFSCLFVITNVEAGRFTVDGWKIEYLRNHPIGTPSNDYDQAVIVVHGTNRNADDYYDYIVSAAETEGMLDHTLILAPKFKIHDDIQVDDELYWSNSGWKQGFKSVNGSRTPSYEIIDYLLEAINDKFPNIEFVTIVGHSAGGQFVQRYAALNEKEQTLRQDLEVRYVVANPSSYLYLTSDRPRSTKRCRDYDTYKYGLADLPGDLFYTDLDRKSIQDQIVSRSIYVLLGTQDNDRQSSNLDTSCMANTQGTDRYDRGISYYEHVKDFDLHANHIQLNVEGVGHNAEDMFNSISGRDAILYTDTND